MVLSKINNDIPQNKEIKIIIQKGEWENSIDILLDYKLKINLVNVYTVLKCYIINDAHAIKQVLAISKIKENETNLIKYESISITKLKKIKFIDFEEYFESLYDSIEKYCLNINFLGFRIIFFKESNYWKEGIVYPVYPWNELIKKNIIKRNTSEEYYEKKNKIQELKKEIKLLKKKLKEKNTHS